MKEYTFTENGIAYKRVNKQTARKAYKNGSDVIVCACKLRPGAPWRPEYIVNRKNREKFVVDEIGVAKDFESIVNSYEFYNCTNAETGKYSAFYIAI